jgi:uncharacterized protein (DUF2252 family)
VRDPIADFQQFNQAFAQRNPELLRVKIARMAASAFAFFRGTFHLFARDLIEKLWQTPAVAATSEAELDLVGDLHPENFGTFRADDDDVHYDINDFDETTRGRFDLDVRRQTTGLILAAQERGDRLADAISVGLNFLDVYTESVQRMLKKGRDLDFDINDKTPSSLSPIDALIQSAAGVKRPAFISKLTTLSNGRRQIVRSLHYFNLPENERAQALRLLADYRKRVTKPPDDSFWEPEDVCGRVSGIGSMGRFRYVVLLAGKGGKDARNVLLEFKEARPSAYDLYRQRDTDPAALIGRAERVIAMQKASQAASNQRLGFAIDNGMSFQVRELGPRDSRIDLKALKGPAELQEVGRAQAAILARVHARSAARVVGVANPLAELNDPSAFCQRILAFALAYADVARSDWSQFVGRRAELEQCERWAAG